MLSIIYGILSAASWGAGDFIGGLASKRTSPYRVLFLAELAGLIPFTALALFMRESIPSTADMLLGAGSSLVGLAGLLLLYRALAAGQMTIAAPVSALFAALIPVIFGFFTLGAPSVATMIGFGLAFLAVWFISQTRVSLAPGCRALCGVRRTWVVCPPHESTCYTSARGVGIQHRQRRDRHQRKRLLCARCANGAD